MLNEFQGIAFKLKKIDKLSINLFFILYQVICPILVFFVMDYEVGMVRVINSVVIVFILGSLITYGMVGLPFAAEAVISDNALLQKRMFRKNKSINWCDLKIISTSDTKRSFMFPFNLAMGKKILIVKSQGQTFIFINNIDKFDQLKEEILKRVDLSKFTHKMVDYAEVWEKIEN